MKQVIKTSIFLTATLVSVNFAHADAKLKISKSSTAVVEIKDGADVAAEEGSALAESMRHMYVESEEADTKDVLEYVETEMGHQEAAASANNSSADEKAEKKAN